MKFNIITFIYKTRVIFQCLLFAAVVMIASIPLTVMPNMSEGQVITLTKDFLKKGNHGLQNPGVLHLGHEVIRIDNELPIGSSVLAFDKNAFLKKFEEDNSIKSIHNTMNIHMPRFDIVFKTPVAKWVRPDNEDVFISNDNDVFRIRNDISGTNNILIIEANKKPRGVSHLARAMEEIKDAGLIEKAIWKNDRRWRIILRNNIVFDMPSSETEFYVAADNLKKMKQSGFFDSSSGIRVDARILDRIFISPYNINKKEFDAVEEILTNPWHEIDLHGHI